MERKDWIVGGCLLAVTGLSVFGIAYSCNQTRAMRCAVLGSAEKIKDLTHIDIDQDMVDHLVQKSVKEQASSVAHEAANKIRTEYANDLRNRVGQCLKLKSSDIEKQVAKEIRDQISGMDKNDIISDVVDRTTELLADKLSEDLDAEVGRIGKIYKGIAAMVG